MRFIILAVVVLAIVFCATGKEYPTAKGKRSATATEAPIDLSPEDFKDAFMYKKMTETYVAKRMQEIFDVVLPWWNEFNTSETLQIDFRNFTHTFKLTKNNITDTALVRYVAKTKQEKKSNETKNQMENVIKSMFGPVKRLDVVYANGSYIIYNQTSKVALAWANSTYVLAQMDNSNSFCGPMRVFRNLTYTGCNTGELSTAIKDGNYTKAGERVEEIVKQCEEFETENPKQMELFSENYQTSLLKGYNYRHFSSFFETIPKSSLIGFLHHFATGIPTELVSDLGVFITSYAFSNHKSDLFDTTMEVINQNISEVEAY